MENIIQIQQMYKKKMYCITAFRIKQFYTIKVFCRVLYVFLWKWRAQVAQWIRWLDYLTTHTSLSPIRHGFVPGFVNYKKGCTWHAGIKFTNCLPMVGGSLRVLWLLLPTKTGHHDIAEILLKVALNTINQINQIILWKWT